MTHTPPAPDALVIFSDIHQEKPWTLLMAMLNKNPDDKERHNSMATPNISPYTLVLTHDVDNLSLRNYPLFSEMTLSFLKRCLFDNLMRTVKGDITFFSYLDSVKWCLLYPLVKIGVVADPWEKAIFDIMALEKKYDVYSTFFFLPFKNQSGHVKAGTPAPRSRATSYDVKKYGSLLQQMESGGWEVGLHGLDAHIHIDTAKEELKIIKDLLPHKEKIGIRMHWLYKSEELWKTLKQAGFYYDATFGTNDEAGFPEGKKQLFKKDNLWVIPLNIMDCTLLGSWLKGLSVKEAWSEIEQILAIAKKEHAVVTILWHTNTFTAFYYWGDVYEKIIQQAISDGARIMRCIDACAEAEKGREDSVSCP